jgi:hypothetical protein
MRPTLAWLLACLLAGAAVRCPAQESPGRREAEVTPPAQASDPALVVTLGSVNKLMQDINYLTAVVGQPQAGGMFTMLAAQFSRGLDATQPIGILVPLVNGAPEPIAMLPTPDVKTVLKSLEAQTGPADELDDGTLVIALGPNTVFIRQVGNWAAVARNKQLLDLAPADPTTFFQGMGNNYDLAVRLDVKQVPPGVRDMVIAQLRQGFEQAMERQAEGDEKSSREMAEVTIDQLEMVFSESDQLEFGWNIDQPSKQMVIDASFTALPGTELASMYAGQQPIPSAFASVIRPDAAAYYHAATSIDEKSIDQTRQSVENSLSTLKGALAGEEDLTEKQKADIEAMIKRIGKLALDSVAEGKADMGALLLADENDFRFVFGSFVSDGDEAAQIVKELAEKVKDEPNAPRFFFDQGKYKGVTMHRVEADVPEKQDEVRKIFGETLKVHVGTGEKSVYLAIGENSESLMQQLIDAGANEGPVQQSTGQLRLTLLPILQYAQSIEQNDTISAMIDALARSPDPGSVIAVSNAIQNGQATKFTIGEGLLQAIGAAFRQSQQARQAAQF